MAVIDDHPEADIESSLNGSTLQESTLGEARTISRATEAKQIREQVQRYRVCMEQKIHSLIMLPG